MHGDTDATRFLRADDGQGVALLRDAQGGAVAQSQLFGNIDGMRHRQDAACGADALPADDHSSVVQGRVFEEDVLDEPLVDVGIDDVARLDDVVERCHPFDDDERTHLVASHVHASHDDGHDGGLVGFGFLLPRRAEEACQRFHPLVGTEVVEKLADVVLEEDDDRQHAHTDKLVHDASQEAHLQDAADKEPHQDEHDDADEHVERPRFLHETVDVVEHHCHEEDVYKVFYAKVKHDSAFLFVAMLRYFEVIIV